MSPPLLLRFGCRSEDMAVLRKGSKICVLRLKLRRAIQRIDSVFARRLAMGLIELIVTVCALSLPRCAVPECRGISHADATFREALWDRFFTAAPRPRTPSELLYSDRRLRSKSSPAATILIRKR